jgi:fatty acid-binding protein DegV
MACIVDRAVARFDMAAEVEAVVLHAAAGANAESLAGRVQTRILVREIRVTECSAAMAAHTGPGFLALAVKPRA